ncbi:MAG: hypothetical protein P1U56_24635 [Saprospiraceae bacterium]|nr:hypothetical protein [Saprospiraceae bacterium]
MKTDLLKLEITKEVENGPEWEVNYNTNYYDGVHQIFENAKLEISKLRENFYSVEFSGIPEKYTSANGSCRIELQHDLIPIWG